MRKLPISAQVNCVDGSGGKSVTVVIHPETTLVTHVVVIDNEGTQRMVPVDKVARSGSDYIDISCTRAELAAMEPFVETQYVPSEHVEYGGSYMLPYMTAVKVKNYRPVETEKIPPEGMAVRRGMQVEASDGNIGVVSALLLDPGGVRFTHIIVESRSFRGKKEVMIPLTAVDRVMMQTVHLNVSKQSIAALPTIPVKRRHFKKIMGEREIELIARIFDEPDRAEQSLKYVEKLHGANTIRLLNAATMVKDADGKIRVNEMKDMDKRKGRRFGAVVGAVVSLLAGPGGLIIGTLTGALTGGIAAGKIDRGFSDKFLKAFETQLKPNNSALILLIEHDWLHSLSQATADLGGVVLQETISDTLLSELENMSATND